MPYYMGITVFVLAGLVLLPFSNDRQKQSTEIELDVTPSTEHTIYTTDVIFIYSIYRILVSETISISRDVRVA
jgi:hypothetical protein